MDFKPGDKFGDRFTLLSKLGSGGMGEVWKARDTELDRDVALKVSKAEFTARFKQEARAMAAFSHPNICQIYDVGPNYIVMELIDGVQLSGPLPVEKAVGYAAQILDALDAAHRKGFTHRDLKPANVMVTSNGAIKLLDFGLAKQTATGLGPDDVTGAALTKKGNITGTLQYMSPEQLNGKEADARSDIFAFGCVLYEMLSGKKAFSGSTTASVIAAIMEREPEPLQTAPPLDRVIRTCLAKDPDERFQTALDLKRNLLWATEGATAAPSQSRFSKTGWIAAAVFAIIAAALAFVHFREKPADRPLVRLDVNLGANVSLPAAGFASSVAISPDGARLVYASGTPTKLFIRRLDQPKANELPGTQGAAMPFFSPDGQWVGFMTGLKLNKISVEGGAVVPLAGIPGFGGASWGEDGNILVTDSYKGLVRIPAGGGPPEMVAEVVQGEIGFTSPWILPGGKAVLFTRYTAGTADAARIEVLTLADRHRRIVVPGGTSARYLPAASSNGATSGGSGHLIYINKATMFAVPFDPAKLETRGTAVPVLDDVAFQGVGIGQFDFSRTGTLVYRRVERRRVREHDDAAMGRSEPARKNRCGPNPASMQYPGLSPDGKRVALSVTEGGSQDIWVYDPQRDAMTRLTFGGGTYRYPVWSPDGQYVVFAYRWQRHLPGSRGWRRPAASADAEQDDPDSVVFHAGWQAAGLLRNRRESPNLDRAAGGAGRPVESRQAGAISQEQLQRPSAVVLARRTMAGVSIERIGKG